MNLQLQSIDSVSGPERARGGKELLLGLRASFTVEGRTIRAIGFGIVREETAAGMKAAVQEAVKQAEEIAAESYDPFDFTAPTVPLSAMKATAKIANTVAVSNAKLKGNEELAATLEKPADEVQQRQLDQVCQELGIASIDVMGLENGSAMCMLKALEALLHEAKANPDGD
jgi:hypothetical protein